ncbi:MAG: TetR/AcrR family transcriptional regulator [Anaerolineae bacterium]
MAAGRPRAFDKESALEAAMLVFWRNGYPGTSLADLTHAMAINKPSLYATFGNKEQLFMAALEQYVSQHSFPILENLFALDQPLEQRLYAYFKSISHLYCHPNLPAGCMLANSMCEAAGDGVPQSAHTLISELNHRAKQRLIDFFTQEKTKGSLKSQSSPLSLALYLMSITSGMAVLARNGATPAELDEMIEHVVTTII